MTRLRQSDTVAQTRSTTVCRRLVESFLEHTAICLDHALRRHILRIGGELYVRQALCLRAGKKLPQGRRGIAAPPSGVHACGVGRLSFIRPNVRHERRVEGRAAGFETSAQWRCWATFRLHKAQAEMTQITRSVVLLAAKTYRRCTGLL